eukprot:gene3618-3961_t
MRLLLVFIVGLLIALSVTIFAFKHHRSMFEPMWKRLGRRGRRGLKSSRAAALLEAQFSGAGHLSMEEELMHFGKRGRFAKGGRFEESGKHFFKSLGEKMGWSRGRGLSQCDAAGDVNEENPFGIGDEAHCYEKRRRGMSTGERAGRRGASLQVEETAESYSLSAQLPPGTAKDSLSIKVDGRVLILQAQIGVEIVSRHLSLPQDVDLSKIEASFVEGKLVIQLPKLAPTEPITVEVK